MASAAGFRTTQFSMPLPMGLGTRIYVHLTVRAKYILLFLTTASSENSSHPAPLGSFVYALPNQKPSDAAQPLSTPLVAEEDTLDFTNRVAKLLARKTRKPVHVGNSISFSDTVTGGSVEEEMAAFRQVMDAVVERAQDFDGERRPVPAAATAVSTATAG